ncbi:MAG: hypothetical protein DRR06_15015 [Gammaproteobacteria bacterium]|nr:MAG: hypothetical protein DRR42_25385 [Gammaproteobacteria bacterium]RLA42139.1 MAG: hypothetical protein DRR06_15015 [Gammaproteobacteria bacterium]
MDNVVSINREGEKGTLARVPVRGSRFFKLADNWYFTTRENTSMGPYDSFEMAEKGADDYVEFVSTATPHMLDALARQSQTAPA